MNIKLLVFLFLFAGFALFQHTAAFAQVPLAGYIRTLGAADTYPTHLDTLQYGGYRSVLNLVSRNNTPNLHRKQGMLVYVQSEDKTYIFKGLIPAGGAKDPVDNSDAAWPEYSPSSLPALSSGQILVGSASNTAAAVSLTGAVSLDNSGNITLNEGSVNTTTLSDAAVSYAKIQPIGPVSLFGNPLNTPASGSEIVLGTGLAFSGNTLNSSGGTVSDVSAGNGLTGGPITSTGTIALANGTAAGQVMFTGTAPDFSPALQTLGGDATISSDGTLTLANGSVSTTTLIADAVTYDKIQKIGAMSLFGNPSSVNPATGSEISLGTGLTFTGNVLNATGGTVSSIAIADANGISGTVTSPATTPVITLSLGAISPASVAATGQVTGSNLSGTNTGDQTIILGGNLSGSGTGSITATIANAAVTYAKIQDMGAASLFGNPTAGLATGREITPGTGLKLNSNTNTLNLAGTAEGQIFITDTIAPFLPVLRLLGGDATINGGGTLSIGESKVTSNKFRPSPPRTLLGNPGSSDDHVSNITLGPGLSLSSGDALITNHHVGEEYGGGVVFYVYDNGRHGLIASRVDQSPPQAVRWNSIYIEEGDNTGAINTRARADGVGAGHKNTAIIVSTLGPVGFEVINNPAWPACGGCPQYLITNTETTFAAQLASDYSVNVGGVVYDDWYLPSLKELKLLMAQADFNGGVVPNISPFEYTDPIDGTTSGYGYWTSTEINTVTAWVADRFDNTYPYNRNSSAYVRAIRAF
ncbi:MAG: hypothetical protein WBP45_14570 [Daejeonella sp.]